MFYVAQVAPTLWGDVTENMSLFHDEIFGPTVNIVKAKDFDHAMHLANAVKYGLSSALFTEDPKVMLHFKENINAGMSSINNSTTGAEGFFFEFGIGFFRVLKFC